MSTAAAVPETFELTGDDARETLLTTGRRRLLKDAFVRLRAADGFSHARSLAYVTALLMIQGVIALVGIAAALGDHGLGDAIARTVRAAAPGPVGRLLTRGVGHVPDLCNVPGINSARRFTLHSGGFGPADESVPKHLAIYEIESDDLDAVMQEIITRTGDGRIKMTDAIQLDPVPVTLLYVERD